MQPPVRWLVATPKPPCSERPGLGAEGCGWVTVQGGPASPWSQLGGTTLAPLTIGHGPSQHS